MALQPGPFRQLSPADVAVTAGVYDFTDDAIALQGTMEGIGQRWDPLISDLADFSALPWEDELGIDLDGMMSTTDVWGGSMPPASLTDALNGWFDAQSMLSTAVSFAPSQAWSDPGAPFVPPDSALTIVPPTIDPNGFSPAPNTVIGQTTEGRNPAVGMFNTTRIGAQSFTVGDQFTVVALGHGGDDVVVDAMLNGVTLPEVDYGPMDDTGQMFISGTIGPETLGVWSQKWYINGQIMANFNFVVSNS